MSNRRLAPLLAQRKKEGGGIFVKLSSRIRVQWKAVLSLNGQMFSRRRTRNLEKGSQFVWGTCHFLMFRATCHEFEEGVEDSEGSLAISKARMNEKRCHKEQGRAKDVSWVT
jgi:hypothetical protein